MLRILLLAAATLLLWGLFAAAAVLGLPRETLPIVGVWSAAVIASAMLCIVVLGRLILLFAVSDAAENPAPPIAHALVYVVLAAAAAAIVDLMFGGNPLAVLTTSAVFSVFVGMALQPTIGALFSGLILQVERRIVPGAWIECGGLAFQVETTGWRAVTGRGADLQTVIVPNAKLVGDVVLRKPDDRATRSSFDFVAPMDIPPHLLSDALMASIVTMPRVVTTLPVSIVPEEYQIKDGTIRYRISYAISNYDERDEIDRAVKQRLWYALQRHRLPVAATSDGERPWQPLPLAHVVPERMADLRLVRLDRTPDLSPFELAMADPARLTAVLSEHGRVLMYGSLEPIIVPAVHARDVFVLIEGELQADDRLLLGLDVYGPHAKRFLEPLPADMLTPFASLATITQRLADDIGPAAETLMRDLAARSVDVSALCTEVAGSIPSLDARARFLDDVMGARVPAPMSPGLLFTVIRDLTGIYRPPTPLKSVRFATIVAVDPSAALEAA